MPDPLQVRWTPAAARDLQGITRYIRRDNPSAARTVAETLFDAANSLDLFPLKGRPGNIAGTRELVLAGLPYVIVYRVTATAVHILRIYHGARDWTRER